MKQDDLSEIIMYKNSINRQLKNIFQYYLNFVQTIKITEQSLYPPPRHLNVLLAEG